MTSSTPSIETFDPASNASRQALYRFAALALVDPRTGSWEDLDGLRKDPMLAEAAAWIRELPQAQLPELGWGERPLDDLDVARVLDLLPDSADGANKNYERVFGLLVSNLCPPHESEYIEGKLSFQRSNAIADVSGFYKAFGLTVSDKHPERHDHVSLELEFMAFLLGLERQAAEGDEDSREDRLEVCRNAQSRFLKEHLAWWLPAFAKLLCKEDRGGYYESVGVFLAALVAAERGILGVSAESRPVAPSPLEEPESCDGCEMSS